MMDLLVHQEIDLMTRRHWINTTAINNITAQCNNTTTGRTLQTGTALTQNKMNEVDGMVTVLTFEDSMMIRFLFSNPSLTNVTSNVYTGNTTGSTVCFVAQRQQKVEILATKQQQIMSCVDQFT